MIKVIIHSILVFLFLFIDGKKLAMAGERCQKETFYESFSGGKILPFIPEGEISKTKANTLPVYWKGIHDCKGRMVIVIHYINSDIDPDMTDVEGSINQETKVGPEVLSTQIIIYEGDDIAEVILMDAMGKISRTSNKREK